MKKTKIEEIKKEILKPKNLWIADTRVCTLYNKVGNSVIVHSESKRKEVPVVYIGDYFIELASIPNNFNLSRCHYMGIEPTKEFEEYVDFKTLKQCPNESWLDLENVTVETLKDMGTVHRVKKYLQQGNSNNI